MVGIDQDTGTKTKEPLMSLSAHCTGKVSQKQLLRVDVIYVCVCVWWWWVTVVHVHKDNNHFAVYFVDFR